MRNDCSGPWSDAGPPQHRDSRIGRDGQEVEENRIQICV
jgi:hypothetical protein